MMSIQRAEELKREWTDRFVVVRRGVPELRRFEGFTGQVRTVNMNGRALVEFGGSADIGWYDIDPAFLMLTEAGANEPVAKSADHASGSATGGTPASGAAAGKPAAAARQAAPAGSSPLDQIRAQSGASPVAKSASAGSPLDQIRQQAAGGSTKTAAAKSGGVGAKASGSSPLDQIRAQSGAMAAGKKPPVDCAVSSSPDSERSAPQSGAKHVRAIYDAGAPPTAAPATVTPSSGGEIPTPRELLMREGFQAESSAPESAATKSVVPSTFQGKKLPKTDDLRIIEGIGSKIAELLRNSGVTTWRILSETESAAIKDMLSAAGSRFQMHDPTTWPHQAKLAHEGRWKELEDYQNRLDGGRES